MKFIGTVSAIEASPTADRPVGARYVTFKIEGAAITVRATVPRHVYESMLEKPTIDDEVAVTVERVRP